MAVSPTEIAPREPPTPAVPETDPIRAAVNACQRELQAAADAVSKFRADWFRENPPRSGEAREDVSQIQLAAVRLQRAASALQASVAPRPAAKSIPAPVQKAGSPPAAR
jgi:hypothetical protein